MGAVGDPDKGLEVGIETRDVDAFEDEGRGGRQECAARQADILEIRGREIGIRQDGMKDLERQLNNRRRHREI